MSTKSFQSGFAGVTEKPKEDVERIRDILFGGQMREYDARLEMAEQSFRSELGAMRKELERHVGEVREQLREEVARVREEVARVREELAREMEERRRGLADLTAQTSLGFTNVENALKAYDGRLTEAERRFQEAMVEKTRYIHEELQASVKSLTQYLDVQTRELKESKLDRADLSKALEFVAGGLAPKRTGQTGPLGQRPA